MGSVGKGKSYSNEYIRFGEIPDNGKSVNYLKMTFSQNQNFTDALDNGLSYLDALKYAVGEDNIDDYLESGISVFKMDSDGLPKLENLEQIRSLISRLNTNIYSVNGTQVGNGQDNEPTVSVISSTKLSITKTALVNKIEKVLAQNYSTVIQGDGDTATDNKIFTFNYTYRWSPEYSDGKPPKYKDGTKYIVFNGVEYSNPKKSGW